MKKFTKILLIGCLLVTVSCNNWLDVDPKSQVKDKDLFASEMGFKEALSGVYSLMTKEALYGKELTFGWLGVLGQEWTSVPYNYEDDQKYDFENAASEVRIDSVWTGIAGILAFRFIAHFRSELHSGNGTDCDSLCDGICADDFPSGKGRGFCG